MICNHPISYVIEGIMTKEEQDKKDAESFLKITAVLTDSGVGFEKAVENNRVRDAFLAGRKDHISLDKAVEVVAKWIKINWQIINEFPHVDSQVLKRAREELGINQ